MAENLRKNKIVLIGASLVLALGLWIYIVGKESVEMSSEVVVDIVTPPEFTVVNKADHVVTVVVSVPRNMIHALERRPVMVRHTLSDATAIGQYSFSLKPQDVDVPSSLVQVKRVVPERITVQIDKIITKRLPIVANLVNEPGAGYGVVKDGIQIDPNAVLVTGAQTFLDKADAVFTEPIDVIGRIHSFRIKTVVQKRPDYQIVNPGPVTVAIPIEETFAEKECKDVPVKVLAPARMNYAVSLDTERISFVVKGPVKVLETLKESDILAFVTTVNLEGGKYKLPVQITLPAGVSLVDSVPVVSIELVEKEKLVPLTSAPIPQQGK